MNIKLLKYIHFVGIKGVGMASLALCVQDLGIKVTGSDIREIFVTDEILRERNINWSEGFSGKNLKDKPDLVVTTGAHGGLNNPEVVAAKEMNIPVITHAEALGELSREKKSIAVCGVGGKTSTSAIIAHILDCAGKSPSYAIGVGRIFPLGYPGRFTQEGEYFVCEADEFVNSPGTDSRPRFSFIKPKIIVVTNIEHDHPDVYPTLDDIKNAFLNFFVKIPKEGLLVANIDNENIRAILTNIKTPVSTYGFSSGAQWRVSGYNVKDLKTHFNLTDQSGKTCRINTNLPGEYNAMNLTAAFIVSRYLGVEENDIINATSSFIGTKRRFEKIGKTKEGALIYDDYAHHPSEIKAVLKAIKEFYPKRRIVAVFQPHTYTRTKVLFNDFAKSFINADVVCFMDIYASAREKPDRSVSSKLLAQEVGKFNKNSRYTGNHKNTLEWLKNNLKAKDVVITIGAGDVFYIHEDLLN